MKFTAALHQLGKIAKAASRYGHPSTVEELQRFSQYNPTALSLQNFVEFGSKNACPRQSYKFLRQELPVRLANIMQEFNHLPVQLRQMPSVELVRSWYMQSFIDILEFEQGEVNDQMLRRFTDQLDIIRNRHAKVVETMAEGVIELKGDQKYDPNMENTIQYFLDRFYMSRISIRMLMSQHLLLFQSTKSKTEKHSNVGCIDPTCDVLHIAEDAFENARFLCEQYYMNSPDCEFAYHNAASENTKERISVTYVPSHLYHILFELIKNALRAVVEYHQNSEELPSIKVLICKGEEDLTIKLSDQGGGISRTQLDLLFNYMYSTAPRPPNPDAASTTPLAGYGYGLPLSRLYAKYFNGDLFLSSVQGFGTDAMVYLKVFPADASELLPVYNKTSLNKYESSIPVGDWSDSTMTTGLHGAVHQLNSPGHGFERSPNAHTKNGGRKTPLVRHFGTLATGIH